MVGEENIVDLDRHLALRVKLGVVFLQEESNACLLLYVEGQGKVREHECICCRRMPVMLLCFKEVTN